MKKMKLLLLMTFVSILGIQSTMKTAFAVPHTYCPATNTCYCDLNGDGFYEECPLSYCGIGPSSSSRGIDEDFLRNDRGWNYDEIYGEPGGVGAAKEDEETYKERGWGISDARLSRPRWQKLSKLPKPRLKRIWHELRKNKTCYCEEGKSYCATSGKDCPDVCIKRFPAFDQFCPKPSAKTEIPEETLTKEEGSQENKEETPVDKWQALKSKGKVKCEDGRAYVYTDQGFRTESYAWERTPQYDQFCPHKWDILNNEKYIWMLYPENFSHVLSMIKYDLGIVKDSLERAQYLYHVEMKYATFDEERELENRLIALYRKMDQQMTNTAAMIDALKKLASTYGSQSQVESLNKLKSQLDKLRNLVSESNQYSSHM